MLLRWQAPCGRLRETLSPRDKLWVQVLCSGLCATCAPCTVSVCVTLSVPILPAVRKGSLAQGSTGRQPLGWALSPQCLAPGSPGAYVENDVVRSRHQSSDDRRSGLHFQPQPLCWAREEMEAGAHPRGHLRACLFAVGVGQVCVSVPCASEENQPFLHLCCTSLELFVNRQERGRPHRWQGQACRQDQEVPARVLGAALQSACFPETNGLVLTLAS